MAQEKSNVATDIAISKTKLLIVAEKLKTVAIKAANAAATMGLSIIASLLVSGIIEWIVSLSSKTKKLKEYAEEATEKIKELNTEFKDKNNYISEYSKRYAELSQKIDQLNGKNLHLSDDEYKEFLDISNELSNLFPELIKGYDDNNNAILNLKGNIEDIIKSFDELIKKESLLTNIEITKNLKDIFPDYNSNMNGYKERLDVFETEYKDFNKSLSKLTFDNVYTTDNNGLSTINFSSKNLKGFNPDEIIKAMNIAYKDLIMLNDYSYSLDKDNNILGYDFKITVDAEDVYKFMNEDNFTPLINKLNNYGSEIQQNINNITQKINEANAELNKYFNSYLQTNWTYLTSDNDVQSVIQSMVNNIDWNKLNIDNLDEASEYIQNNIISLFNGSYLTDELKQKMVSLFTIDTKSIPNQEYINLYNEVVNGIQTYFKNNNINVPLNIDFIINNNSDMKEKVRKSIYEDTQRSPTDYNYLLNYTSKLTYDQLNIWLKVDDIDSVTEKIKAYEKEVIKSNELDFFTDSNKELINQYIEKLNKLGEYLEKAHNRTLSSDDIIDLSLNYNIASDSIDKYEEEINNAIQTEIINAAVLDDLRDAISNCDNIIEKTRLISIYEALIDINTAAASTTDKFKDIGSAISSLESSSKLLRDINKENINGGIKKTSLDEILSIYPELESAVSSYNIGLTTSQELFDELKKVYADDELAFKELNAEKLKYNTDFYTQISNGIGENIIKLADSYDINLSNYTTYSAAKIGIAQETQKRIDEIENSTEIDDGSGGTSIAGMSLLLGKYYGEKQVLEDKQTIIDALLSNVPTFNTSWEGFGSDDDKTNSSIDWIANSISNVTKEVDNLNQSLSNTNSFKEKLNIYKKLIEADQKLIDADKKAETGYETEWENKSSKISKNYINKIMSGEKFTIEEFTDDTSYNNVVAAQKAYHDWQTSKKTTITDENKKESDEDAKIQTLAEQKQLNIDNIQIDMKSAFTSKRKNELLKKEKTEKEKLLDYNLKLANSDEEKLKLQKEYNQYVEDNTRQQYENIKAERDNRISHWESVIQDNQNIIDLDKAQGKDISENIYKKQNNAYKHKIVNYENEYKSAIENRDKIGKNKYGDDNWEKYNKEAQEAEDNINKCKIAQIENNKAIAALPLKPLQDETEELEKQLKIQEEKKSKVETAISEASAIIQDEINSQNDLKEAIQNSYDSQIDVIQDKIDALSKVNEQQERELNLEKAKYNLNKAMNQKTVKVFKDGKFVYDVDYDVVREAEKELEKTQYDSNIANLNDQKNALEQIRDEQTEAIDKQIKGLTTYKDELDKVINQWQRVYDLQELINLCGEDIIEKLQSEDFSAIKDLSKYYSDSAEEVKTTTEKIDQNKETLEVANKFIEEWNGAEKELPDILTRIGNIVSTNTDIDKAIEDKNKKISTISTTWNDNNIDIKESLDLLNSNYSETGEEETVILNKRLENIKSFATQARTELNSIVSELSKLSDTKINVSVDSDLPPSLKGEDTGESHLGMKLGYIRKGMPNGRNGVGSLSKDDLTTLSLRKLDDDEMLRILKFGECVMTESDQANILSNMKTSFITGLNHAPILSNISQNVPSNSLQFNGDIIIQQPIGNVDTLAKKIQTDFLSKIDQNLYKK